MINAAEVRYVVRSSLFGVSAFLVSLQASALGSSITSDEVVNAGLAGGIAALAYAGIGAVSKNVEPNIGRKADDPAG